MIQHIYGYDDIICVFVCICERKDNVYWVIVSNRCVHGRCRGANIKAQVILWPFCTNKMRAVDWWLKTSLRSYHFYATFTRRGVHSQAMSMCGYVFCNMGFSKDWNVGAVLSRHIWNDCTETAQRILTTEQEKTRVWRQFIDSNQRFTNENCCAYHFILFRKTETVKPNQ